MDKIHANYGGRHDQPDGSSPTSAIVEMDVDDDGVNRAALITEQLDGHALPLSPTHARHGSDTPATVDLSRSDSSDDSGMVGPQLPQILQRASTPGALEPQSREGSVTPGSGVGITAADHNGEALRLREKELAGRECRYLGNLPDLRVVYETSFEWRIEDYYALRSEAMRDPETKRRLLSPEHVVDANGDKWRMLMFPAGNNSDHISLYVDFASASEQKPGWSRTVQFSMRIHNPEDERAEIFKEATHRFNAAESDWGFTAFHPMAELNKPVPGTGHALLTAAGGCVISAYIRVVHDPVGTLWIHSWDAWDSRIETGFVGLKNQGATCYLSSLLQSLYSTNYFRKAVYQIPTENDDVSKSVSLALQRVFYQLQTSKEAVATNELTKSFGWDTMDAFMQHDVQEFNRVLQDNLETKMKGTKAEGAIERLFVGKMKSYIKCVNVDFESSREETFYDIQLNVKGMKTLADSFKDYVAVEMLDGENKYQSEKFGLQDAKKGVIFTAFPPVLHLQLKRFEYDFERDAMVKINDRHEYPDEIDLSEFLEEGAATDKPSKYHLHGVLVHQGDVNGGHYYAFIKSTVDGRWLKFDDDRVHPVAAKEVFEEHFGDTPPPAVAGATAPLRLNRYNVRRFTNAYMLVYIRDADVPTVLEDVTIADVPAHIPLKIAKESEEKERRDLERAERHLYMNVRVLREENVRGYQGFDMWNWDARKEELVTVRAKRQDKWVDVATEIAGKLGLQPGQVRLWSFHKRQNHTFRLEQAVYPENPEETLEQVVMRTSKTPAEFQLYAETSSEKVTDANGNIAWFPVLKPNEITLSLKFYDPAKQEFQFLGTIRADKISRIGDLFPRLIKRKGLPTGTALTIYEEVKPGMIEPHKPSSTLAQSELGDGDILTFQVEVPKEHEKAYEYPLIPQYYTFLQNRITIFIRPFELRDDPKKATEAGFSILLSKRMTYDQVASKVGTRLGKDPTKLRFWLCPTGGDTPRDIIKRNEKQTLHEIIESYLYSSAITPAFWVEVMDISYVELATKRMLRVTYLDANLREKEPTDVLVSRESKVADVLAALAEKLKLAPDAAQRLRLFVIKDSRHTGIIPREYEVSKLTSDHENNLYAEETPAEELAPLPVGARLISVFRFSRDITNAHSIPFKLVLRHGETVADVTKRIQARLGYGEMEWSKVRVFATTKKVTRELEDADEVIGDLPVEELDAIALEHADRSAIARRYVGMEKSIKIHN